MSKLTILILIFFAAALVQEFSFTDAVQEMLRENPKLAQTKMQSDASRNQLNIVKAGYWPQLDFVESWSDSNNPVYAFGNLRLPKAGEPHRISRKWVSDQHAATRKYLAVPAARTGTPNCTLLLPNCSGQRGKGDEIEKVEVRR